MEDLLCTWHRAGPGDLVGTQWGQRHWHWACSGMGRRPRLCRPMEPSGWPWTSGQAPQPRPYHDGSRLSSWDQVSGKATSAHWAAHKYLTRSPAPSSPHPGSGPRGLEPGSSSLTPPKATRELQPETRASPRVTRDPVSTPLSQRTQLCGKEMGGGVRASVRGLAPGASMAGCFPDGLPCSPSRSCAPGRVAPGTPSGGPLCLC